MNQARVAPSPDGGKKPPLSKKQQSSRNVFQTSSNNRPRQYELSENRKRRWKDEELAAKKSTYIFILVFGLVLIAGGSPMTWWGTQSDVKDLLIIGPGCIVIGFGFVLVGISFVVRTLYYKWQAKFAKSDQEALANASQLEQEYYIPVVEDQANAAVTQSPTRNTLYGADDLARARRASMMTHQATTGRNGVVTPPLPLNAEGVNPHSSRFYVDNPNELGAPVVSFPKSIVDEDVAGPTYKVVMDSQLTKNKPRDTLATIRDEETDNDNDVIGCKTGQPVKSDHLKSRPDSGFIAGTPDTLDTMNTMDTILTDKS